MSIIQKALEKAQSDVGSGGLTAQKIVKPGRSLRKALIIALIFPLIVYVFFYSGRLLSRFHDSSYTGTSRGAHEVVYKPLMKNISKSSAAGSSAHVDILKMPDNPRLVLNGIMYMEDGPKAIINNLIVGRGDSVSGARIVKIDSRNVVLEYENVEITLNLK